MATKSRISTSNTVETIIKSAQISNVDGGFVKTLDKLYADVGDTITYTITLRNTGNTAANNVIFSDTIPMGSEFVDNSFTLNGINQPGINPQTGLTIGLLPPGVEAKLQFKVIVITIPDVANPDSWVALPNITNQSILAYTYTTDPLNPNGQSARSSSNLVSTAVVYGQLGDLMKTVDKTSTDIGDEITYSISSSNMGVAALNNIVVRDTIPSGTKFVPGSVIVNGINQASDIQDGVSVGTLLPGENFDLSFRVLVTTLPTINPIPNQARVTYDFIVDPSLPNAKTKSTLSNTIFTMVNNANLSIQKLTTPIYTTLNDTITYSIVVKNTGSVTANDVLVIDTIPSQTTFIDNSINVNGNLFMGNPQTGILVGNIAKDSTSTVSFQVVVNTVPSPNMISNQSYATYTYISNTDNNESVLGSSISNVVNNYVQNGAIGIKLSADTQFAALNEIITYTADITNIGNILLDNVVVFDTIPKGTTLVPGSVSVNGYSQPGANLNNGVGIGRLPVGATSQMVFKVTVVSMPDGLIPNKFSAMSTNFSPNVFNSLAAQSATLENQIDVRVQYTVDQVMQNVATIRETSNLVITAVRDAIIGAGPNSFIKIPDKYYADLGDIITYTVYLMNSGNLPGNNVILRDNIPEGTVFIENSVVVNGTQLPGFNPANGILLGTINPNDSVVISFQVKVEVVPTPNVINNQAMLSYSYTKDDNYPDCEYVTGTSTPTEVIVNHGEIPSPVKGELIGFTKTADKEVARRGDVITYCFNIPNTGNVVVDNVIFRDLIPDGTVLIRDSVVVDGGALIGANPEEGILIGSINPGESSNVFFKVEVQDIPAISLAINTAYVDYKYYVDPAKPEVEAMSNSNTVTIKIGDAFIDFADGGLIKYVDKEKVEIGDIILYTLAIKNTGNVDALDALITDTIPSGSKFIQGSVTIDGEPKLSLDPTRGIGITCLSPNVLTTLTFKAMVESIPKTGMLKNSATIGFEYKNDMTKPPITGGGNSNEVTTLVRSVSFEGDNFLKTANASYTTIGDIITYTININNAGNINAENVWFYDTIVDGTLFVNDSVKVNGFQYPGVSPQQGVYIGTIMPAVMNTITFKVRVVSIPSGNLITNTGRLKYERDVDSDCNNKQAEVMTNSINITIKSPNINIVKSSNVEATVLGEVVTYKLVVMNTGNVEVENFILSDQIPPELEFIQGSVTINGEKDMISDIISGIDLGAIYSNIPVIVTFDVLVVEKPDNNIITNKANGFYYFKVDPKYGAKQGEVVSNEAYLRIEVTNLFLEKTSDKELVVLGDTITYSLIVKNTGTLSVNEVLLIDNLPPQLIFVKNSLVVNGNVINSVNIEDGINIGTLMPDEKAIVKYKAILSKSCGSCIIENKAYAVYNFKSSPNVEEKTKTTDVVSVIVKSTSPTFKEICIDGILYIPQPKIGVQDVDCIDAEVEILKYHIVKTIKAVSEENKRLTGYKLIVNGIVRQMVEYTSCDKLEAIHSAKFERKFSSFIILPEDYEEGSNITVNGVVEDVYYNKLNDREIFSNVTILLQAINLC